MAKKPTGKSAKSNPAASNQMWGGRFADRPDEIMEAINASIEYDRKLYAPGHRRLEGARRHACRQGHYFER